MNKITNINKIELTCRAGEDPVIRKETEGTPDFVTVFCLHNRYSKSGENVTTIPIVVKANRELSSVVNLNIKKGYRFNVSGRLDYWKSPESNKENYSIWADTIEEIMPPKGESNSPETVGESAD